MLVPFDEIVEYPTTKQLIVIRYIEENTPHRFEGDTKQGAAKFISAHIEESKQNQEREGTLIEYNRLKFEADLV